MAWRLRWDAAWEIDIPVFKFTGGSEVVTKIGIEDRDGTLRIFSVNLNATKGIKDIAGTIPKTLSINEIERNMDKFKEVLKGGKNKDEGKLEYWEKELDKERK